MNMFPLKNVVLLNNNRTTKTPTFLDSIVDDMVLWWDMQDTGDTLTDYSGNNNTGTVTNATNTTISERNWKSVDAIDEYISSSNTIPPLSSFTIGGVFIPHTVQNKFLWSMTSEHCNISFDSTILWYRGSSETWINSGHTITLDNPVFIFISNNESNSILYVNGQPVATKSAIGSIGSNKTLFLNRLPENGEQTLFGETGLFLLFDRVLTPEEHLQLFNEEKSKYGIS